jgi:hypothetical protein
MTAQNPATLTEWLQNLPIPWLVGGPVGKAEVTAYGSIIDGIVVKVKDVTRVRFPDFSPPDGLPHIGAERLLVRGPAETDGNYATRLRTAWDDWARAGTALELLVQLWWAGFEHAVFVQQNGVAFYLSGAPTAGQDPTSLLVQTNCSVLPTAMTAQLPLPSGITGPTSIAAGTPWWTFDSEPWFGSRFAILLPRGSTWLMTYGVATFASANSATLTWNKPLENGLTYSLLISNPTVTSGGSVKAYIDPATVTATGATVSASAAFSGSISVFAFPSGGNPFFNISQTGIGNLSRVIRTWRPSRATCMNVLALQQGAQWGWPPTRTWGSGTWGGTVISIPGTWS